MQGGRQADHAGQLGRARRRHLQGQQGDNEPNQVSQLDRLADVPWKLKQSVRSERHLPPKPANECTSQLRVSALNPRIC